VNKRHYINFTNSIKAWLVCLFLFPTALITFGQPPVPGLVLCFPQEVIGQQQIEDWSGCRNNGAPISVVVSDSPSLVSMQKTRQLTFAAWIKPNSIPREFPVILSKGGNQHPGAYGGYELLLNSNGDNDLVFESGNCEIFTREANGRWINNHLGEWIHVAFVIDAKTKTAKFYVNGQPTNDEYNSGTYDNINFDLPNDLYIGAPDPASNANRTNFDGAIRELMLFNRALSAKEIREMYLLTKPHEEKRGSPVIITPVCPHR
jgi:hypothetical protein